MHRILRDFWVDETGQDLIEYTLILAFVALAAAAIFGTAGQSVNSIWTKANTKVQAADGAVQ